MTSLCRIIFVALLVTAPAAPALAQTYTFNPTGGPYVWGNAAFWAPSSGAPPDAPGEIARFNSLAGAYSVGLDNDYTVTAVQYGPAQTGAVTLSFLGGATRAVTLTPGVGANGADPANNGLTTLYVEAGSGNHTLGATTRLQLGGPAGSAHVWDIQGGTYTVSGQILAGASTNTLTKVGSGMLVLAGNSSAVPAAQAFQGGLFVQAGTVLANATGFSAAFAPITVNGGTLGGSGRIDTPASGVVTVNAGGTLTAGTAAATPKLSLVGGNGLVMGANSTYVAKLFGTGASAISLVDVTGNAVVNTNKLTLDLGGITPAQAQQLRSDVGFGNTRTYTVLTSSEGLSTTNGTGFDTAGFKVVNNNGFNPDDFTFGLFDIENGVVTINFSPVPEPAAALGVLGVALAVSLRRPRRASRLAPECGAA